MKRCPVPHPNNRGKTAHNQGKYIPDVKFRDLAMRTLRPCPMPGLVMRLIHCCTVRAILIRRLGGPEVLQVADVPEPVPARGQVLGRATAGGSNFADTMTAPRGSRGAPRRPSV